MKFSLTVMSGLAGLMLTSLTAQAADVTMRISLQLPMKSHLGQNLQSGAVAPWRLLVALQFKDVATSYKNACRSKRP